MRIRRSCIITVGIAVGVMAVVVVAAGAFLISRLPDVARQVPPTPIIVTLKTPLNGSTLQLNSPTSVEAEALGDEPITAMELWVDGVLVQTGAPSALSGKRFTTLWSWMPGTEGYHTLVARAVGQSGATVQSNVVAVEVIPGESSSSEQLVGLPPQLPEPPESPAPEKEPEPPYSGPVGGAPGNPPDKGAFWGAGKLQPNPDPPAAPKLTASVEGCNVNLFIEDQADDESGFFIYRYGPMATDFGRIATLGSYDGAQPFQYTDADLFGSFMYYVAAFNPGGESISNLYSVKVNDPACLTDEWSKLGLSGGQITTSEPVDRLYCYLSVDDGPWARIPAGPNDFLYPDQNGVFDVSAYLETLASPPPAQGVTLALDCWGWADGTLLYLGAGKQTIPPQNQAPVQIGVGMLQLIGQAQVGAIQQTLGGGGGLPNASLFQPQFLKTTQNPQECGQHASGLAALFTSWICGAAIAEEGYTALVWEWEPGGCWPGAQDCVAITDIDGFRLYEVGSGYEPPVLIQTNTDPGLMIFAVPPQWPKLDGTPHCYVVRAYADTFMGGIESANSNVACLTQTGVSGVETVTLQPAAMGTVTETYYPDCGGASLNTAGAGGESAGLNEILVGYDGGQLSDGCFVRHWYEGAVRFDLSSIGQRSLLNATLRYQRSDSSYSYWAGEIATNEGPLSCARDQRLADVDWSGIAGAHIPGTYYRALELYNVPPWGQPFVEDVTSVVVHWRDNPDENYGFTFSNGGPSVIPNEENHWEECLTRYSSFELEVTYFPNP